MKNFEEDSDESEDEEPVKSRKPVRECTPDHPWYGSRWSHWAGDPYRGKTKHPYYGMLDDGDERHRV